MPYDPYPMLRQLVRVVEPVEAVGVDLDNPKVWSRPPVTDYRYLVVHWGGGPNPAGQPVEEPSMTGAQKWAVILGRCKTVLRSWHGYHVKSRGMSAIAYSTGVPVWGKAIFRLRGHRYNGGQWGTQNTISHALVLIMGLGQKATGWAWRMVGLVWFCSGGPEVVGHRFFNSWPQTQTKTTCPGDQNAALIADERHIRALGRFTNRTQRGVAVKAATLKLARLGYLDRLYRRYRPKVRRAVEQFQQDHPTVDEPGVLGPSTWRMLARTES